MSHRDSRQSILQDVSKVPLLSPNAARLLQLMSKTDHKTAEVIDLVRCDAALTARVLRVVNSAAYGLLNPISTIDRALAYLGERMVVCIAIGESAGKLMKKPMAGYEAVAGDLWRHDLFTAIASREVARYAKDEVPIDMAFTGGLLHDIGKGVITDYLQGTASEVIGEIARGELQDYLAGEKNLLGMDHTDIGLELARNWDLPASLQAIIALHHRPVEAAVEERSLVYAVHLGDIVAMMCGYATGSDGMQYQLDHGYQEYFDLTHADLPKVIMAAQEEFAKIQDSLHSNPEVNT